ncbi:MAG TPA: chemotaxis protein CheW [Spirochaetota bacterium]|nr:chemotaxis protein CheW [Spirochaetota bacterium]HPS85696.1 chemotaxis protein CheW [Spirochaetota bacterium]
MGNFVEKNSGTGLIQSDMFVTFSLNDEIFGIDVMKVEEIIGFIPVTHIPDSITYLKGVINLRGKVVPVIDLRLKFRMDEKTYDASTVILIVNVENRSIGLIADSVSDVADIPIGMIHEYSKVDYGQKNHSVKYIANYNDELVLILDIDSLMDDIDALPDGDDIV